VRQLGIPLSAPECGDLTRPDSIVLAQRDFNTYFAGRPRLAERLRTTLESKTALFLGYSLQDPFFNQIWDNIGLDFGAHRRMGYAVMFDVPPLEADDLRQRSIHMINLATGPGSDRTQLLETWLREVAPIAEEGERFPPSPSLLRPPVVGFVARRDQEGRDIVARLKEDLTPQKNQLIVLWGPGGVGKTTLAAEAARGLTGVFGPRIVWMSADGRADLTLATFLDEIATQLGRPDLRKLAPEPKEERVRALVATAPTLLVLDNFETIAPEEQTRCADFLAQRAPWLALSLFVPGATRPALAEVAGLGDDVKHLNQAVKRLAALWLVGTTEGGRCLTVEGLTRELARARLAKDARADEFHRRFVAHFLRYANSHARPTPEDFDALEAEKDNLLSAMDVAFGMRDWDSVMGIADILAKPVSGMLSVHGYWDEAIMRNEQARDAARAMNQEHQVAVYSHRAGIIRQTRGEYDAARLANEEALAIYKKLKAEANVAVALHQLGMIAQAQGDLAEARRLYAESLEIERKLGNQNGIAISLSLHQLGRLAQAQGDLAEARRLYAESLEINKKLGNQSGIAKTLNAIGNIATAEGRLDEARELLTQSLEIAKRLGDQLQIGYANWGLSGVAEKEGDKAEAARLLRETVSIFEKLGSPKAEIARRSLERVGGKD
jgi:tetratricopeptide (TPR) repeat protein